MLRAMGSQLEEVAEMQQVNELLKRRWVCSVVRSGYHNGSPCEPNNPHSEPWQCGYRWELSLTDVERDRLMGVPLMFAVDRLTLLKSLEQLRRNKCLYGRHAQTCDCKFGNTGDKPVMIGVGEVSGCAELEQCIRMFSAMGDNVFDTYARQGVREAPRRDQRDA